MSNTYSRNSLDGGYAFLPPGENALANTYAFLVSEVFYLPTSPKGRCLTFWFYMNGHNSFLQQLSNNFLEFYLFDTTMKTYIFLWLLRDTNMGDQWNYGSFPFYYTRPYEIWIKVNANGNDYKGCLTRIARLGCNQYY